MQGLFPGLLSFLQGGGTAPVAASLAQSGPPAVGGFGGMMSGGPMAPAAPPPMAAPPTVQMPMAQAPTAMPTPGAAPTAPVVAGAGQGQDPRVAAILQALQAQQKPEQEPLPPPPSVNGPSGMSPGFSQAIMQSMQAATGNGMLPGLGSLIRGR